jgi:hypothetical protein
LIGRIDSDGNPTEGSLLAYAAHEMELSARQADGLPLRAHLESAARQTGTVPEQLLPVECPESVLYIWEYFSSMNDRRTFNEHGPNPITHEGVEAWARRRGIALERFEQDALDALEGLYFHLRAVKK